MHKQVVAQGVWRRLLCQYPCDQIDRSASLDFFSDDGQFCQDRFPLVLRRAQPPDSETGQMSVDDAEGVAPAGLEPAQN